MNYRVIGAVAALLSAALGALAVNDSSSGKVVAADQAMGTSASEMQELSEENPSVPLILPVEIPGDYGWGGVGRVEGEGQTVWAVSSQFTSVAGGPIVEVCVKAAQERRGCEGADEAFHETRVDGMRVLVSMVDPSTATEDDKAPWMSTRYTTDYENVSWIR